MSKATSARTEVTTDIEATTDRAGNSTCNSSVSNINATPTGVTPLINTTAASTVEMNIGGVECERCLEPCLWQKANLRKHEANVPQDVDYDIWLHAASVHKVKDKMKNSLYSYFIGKRIAFPVLEWFVRNNWEKCRLKIVTLVKGFLFFKFSSIEGVDSVLRDGLWMIRGIPIFLNKWSPSMSLRRFVSCSSLGEISQCPVGFLYIGWIKLDRHENR
ncbi:zinc knuckle CX2CX4HX4C containing protein [Tanacetum coccineum]